MKTLLIAALATYSANIFASEKFALHSEPAKAKQIQTAMGVVGALTQDQVTELVSTSSIKNHLLGMLDPMVHRQGAQNPFEKPLPGPGFDTFQGLIDVIRRNPNADLFPKIGTRLWSKELKASLAPYLERGKLGVRNGADYELTPCDTVKLVMEIIEPGGIDPGPPPGFKKNSLPAPRLTPEQWYELRDHIGELILRYKATLENCALPKEKPSATH